MTNKQFFESCSSEELANTLAEMITDVIEQITGKLVSDEEFVAEVLGLMDFLEEEFIEPCKYLS